MEEPFQQGGVRGILHQPEQPAGRAVVLAHGAGADAQAPLLASLGRAFADNGYLALRYDLPFRRARPKGPPHPAGAARDREGIAAAIEAVRALAPGCVIAGGHSYGGRQTAMLAAESPGVAAALLLLSYPLHPPRQPERLRTAFFPALRTPALFVHGTADPFASIEELRDAMALIPARTDLLVVEGAAHDLKRAPGLISEMLARLDALLG